MNMLQLRACFTLAALACGSGAALAQETEAPARRYLVEKGVLEIEKTTKGAGVEVLIEETVYFDDWGNTEARLTTTKTKNPFLKEEQVQRTWTLRKEGTLTSVNLDTMTGTRMADPSGAFLGGMTPGQQQQFGAGVMEGLGAKTEELDDREHLGKTCKVTETSVDLGGMKMTTTTWTWKNITMRMESSGMGNQSTEVVKKIQTGIDLPAEKLRVPEGAQIKEMQNPLGGLGGYRKKG